MTKIKLTLKLTIRLNPQLTHNAFKFKLFTITQQPTAGLLLQGT